MRLNGYQGSLTQREDWLFRNGHTDYTVLLPENATESERFAAQELTDIFRLAGVEIATETDGGKDADPEKRYIAVGNTVYFRALGLTMTREEYLFDGFLLETVGNTHVIKGVGDTGTCFGVYGFCEYAAGYVFYTPDERVIQKEAQNREFHLRDIPSFLGRHALGYNTLTNPDYSFRLRINGEFCNREARHGEGSLWSSLEDQSNALQILDYTKYRPLHPDWFYLEPEHESGKPPVCYPQICFSKGLYDEEFFNTYVGNLINNYIIPEKDKMFFMLGMSDNRDFCTCPKCQEEIARYTRSGLSVRFVNKVADAVEAWRRENAPERILYLVSFAYLTTFDPPVREENGVFVPIDESVVARENVIIQNAPIRANFLYPILDPEHNADSRRSLLGWKAVSRHMCVWDYRQDFRDNAFPYPSGQTAQQNLEIYKDMGMMEVLNQNTSLSPGPPFAEMDDFARARLHWNLKEDYHELASEFRKVYYKSAAPYIDEYLQAIEDYYPVMIQRGWTVNSHHAPLIRPYLHTVEDMYRFKAILDKALAAADNETVYKRVNYLTLFYKSTLLMSFASQLDRDEALAMVESVREITRTHPAPKMSTHFTWEEAMDDCEAVILGQRTDAERKIPHRAKPV